MMKYLSDVDARLLIFVKHPIHQVFRFVTYAAPHVIGESEFLLNYVLRCVTFMICEEWQSQSQHYMDYDSERPNVRLLSVRMVQNDLWGTICKSAEGVLALFVWKKYECKTKIYEFCYWLSLIILINKYILHFYISMHYSQLIV